MFVSMSIYPVHIFTSCKDLNDTPSLSGKEVDKNKLHLHAT